ncbi:MAG: preprotein translocase subunit SecG [Candidatus Dojkabacteria bacterium]|nr:MAG: preprotein translocase subunit SecG [Candidatus Dojkabacteria bacterium]
MTQQVVNILQIIVSIIGIIFILLQNRSSEQGSSFFGGGGEVFKIRKGLDRFLFAGTIIVVIALAVLIYVDIKMIS